MTSLCCDVLTALQGKTLVTAESLTGGGIGAALTAVSGSSAVYKGGIISYTNEVKHRILGVSREVLDQYGAVSAPVAQAMAAGVRKLLEADIAVSVTGLAGPGGDEYGNPVSPLFLYAIKCQLAFLKIISSITFFKAEYVIAASGSSPSCPVNSIFIATYSL